MLVITVGYLLGRLTLRRVSLGPAAATMFVALGLGSLGVGVAHGTAEEASLLGSFGLALFIYAVGFEAGPRFFESFRDRTGWRFVLVGSLVNLLAIAVALLCASWFGLDGASTAGLLAGALTSAPTLGAASEVVQDRAALSIAFALSYPVGLVGLVLLIQFLPKLLQHDLAKEAADTHEWLGPGRRAWRVLHESGSPEVTRTFEVTVEDAAGRSLRELDIAQRTGCVVSRIHRAKRSRVATGDFRLEPGDLVTATGRLDELQELQKMVGPEVHRGLPRRRPSARRIRVESPTAVGKCLADLAISACRCVVTKIERGEVLVEPGGKVRLARHDVVEVVGERNDVRQVAALLGPFERPAGETDIAIFAGGILVGMLIGSLTIPIGSFDLKLGMAGGLLLVGLCLGHLSHSTRLAAHVPPEARQLVRDLGILLFVADIGLHSGASLAAGVALAPWKLLASSAIVLVCSVVGALQFGRVLLRLRPVDAWGSVCGGLTSTAALHAVRNAADSGEPAISFAAAYAMASILAAVAGQVVLFVLGS